MHGGGSHVTGHTARLLLSEGSRQQFQRRSREGGHVIKSKVDKGWPTVPCLRAQSAVHPGACVQSVSRFNQGQRASLRSQCVRANVGQ